MGQKRNDPHQQGKIVALGELLVDLIPGTEKMRISQAGPVIKTASGSAGIFACAATLLGNCGGFIGKVGRDALSQMVEGTLREQGVDLSNVVTQDDGQTGLAFIEYLPEGRNYQYYRTGSVGSLLRAEELNEDYIASAYAVHYPGMLLSLTPEMNGACHRLVELARKSGALVSFDPNIRRELTDDAHARAELLWAMQNADIVAPTLREGQMLTGKERIGDVLRAIHEMGPRMVALTRDRDGAVLSCDGMVAVAEGIDEPPVDPTGAGDTFAAALCVGMREGMELERLAHFCNCAGTLVITKRGAIGMALPTRAQVEELMSQNKCKVTLYAFSELPD